MAILVAPSADISSRRMRSVEAAEYWRIPRTMDMANRRPMVGAKTAGARVNRLREAMLKNAGAAATVEIRPFHDVSGRLLGAPASDIWVGGASADVSNWD